MNILFTFLILSSFSISFADGPDEGRQELLDYLVDNHSRLQEPYVKTYLESCPQMQHTSDWCLNTYNYNSELLSNLSELLSEVRNDNISERRAYEVAACLPVSPPQFEDLEAILGRLDSKDECSPMEAGDFKVSQFLLQRRSDGNYDAVVNVDFQQVSGSTRGPAMQARINECLSSFTPYLRSPGGETLNVRVMSPAEVDARFPIGMRPPSRVVRIHSGTVTASDGSTSPYRANADNYPDDIDCSTIIHETLHHLGLCDEYQETSTEIEPTANRRFVDAFSCRSVPQRNTIMGQHERAIAEVVPRQFSCQCRTEACRNTLTDSGTDAQNIREMMRQSPSNIHIPYSVSRYCEESYLHPSTPMRDPDKRFVITSSNSTSLSFENRTLTEVPGSGPVRARITVTRSTINCNCNGDAECLSVLPRVTETLNRHPSAESCPSGLNNLPGSGNIAPEGGETRVEGDILRIVTAPAREDSLLLPNHFNRILFRNCPTGQVADYNQCASFAYTSTTDAQCSMKPSSCGSDAFFLGEGVE